MRRRATRSRMCFAGQGHECELAADAAAALGLVERVSLDAVICDVRMNGMSGLDLLDRVKRTHPALPFVIITGVGGVPGAVDAMKRGAFQYVTKPCDLDELRVIVEGAIDERRRHADAGAERPSSFPAGTASQELIGSGPAMRSLRASIHLVAASSAPVVVTGETGVGKELVARAIHAGGSRRSKPFVAVNTSAIPQRPARERDLRTRARRVHRRRSSRAKGFWRSPTAARCCSTRSATCRPACRRSSCACFSSGTCARWAAIEGARSTFA